MPIDNNSYSLCILLISGDDQIRLLKERLEETEKAMKMIVSHMATITTQMPKPISTTNTDNENNSESNKQEIIEEKSNSIPNNTKDISDNKPDLNSMSDQTLKDANTNQMPNNEMSKDVSDDSNDDSEYGNTGCRVSEQGVQI